MTFTKKIVGTKHNIQHIMPFCLVERRKLEHLDRSTGNQVI